MNAATCFSLKCWISSESSGMALTTHHHLAPKRVGLYFYSSCVPTWPVLRWTVPLPCIISLLQHLSRRHDLWFAEQCWWALKFSGMWCSVIGCIVPGLWSKYFLSSEVWTGTHPVTQCHIPEDLNPQVCRCWHIEQKCLLLFFIIIYSYI